MKLSGVEFAIFISVQALIAEFENQRCDSEFYTLMHLNR